MNEIKYQMPGSIQKLQCKLLSELVKEFPSMVELVQ